MSARSLHKRQMKLLRRLATIANYRTDRKLSLEQVAPQLDIRQFVGGTRFINKTAPSLEDSCELSYDFSSLLSAGYIESCYLSEKRDSCGGIVYEGVALRLTAAGIALVRDLEEPWLSKAIAKQPMTFFLVVIAALQGLWTIGLVYWTWWLSRA